MDDSVGVYLWISCDDLLEDVDGFRLWQGPSGGDEPGKISSFAVFGDDVGIVFGGIDLFDIDDMLVFPEGL